MDDELCGAHRPPTDLSAADDTGAADHGLRHRATAGAAALGASALLVLSFGPSALALEPSSRSAAPDGSTWASALEAAPAGSTADSAPEASAAAAEPW